MTEPPAKKLKMESDDSPSPPPFSKYTRSEQVTLVIGPDEQELTVCGHLLAKTSEFFETALKKEWKEGQTRIIKLPEDNVESVTHYLDFVHGEGLPSESIKHAEDVPDGSSDTHPNRLLIGLYILSERVLNTTLQNAVIKEILRLVSLTHTKSRRNVPSLHAISEIYKGTTDGSPVRRLMVDLYVTYAQQGAMIRAEDNPAFVRDVAEALLAKAVNRQSPNNFRFRDLDADDYLV
jgi:hypothetical protein